MEAARHTFQEWHTFQGRRSGVRVLLWVPEVKSLQSVRTCRVIRVVAVLILVLAAATCPAVSTAAASRESMLPSCCASSGERPLTIWVRAACSADHACTGHDR